MCNAEFEAAKLGKATQAAVEGVAGVGGAAQIIAHLVSVVGADRNRTLLTLLDLKQSTHHIVHRHITLQMISLVEVTVGISLGTTQVDKADPTAKLTHHSRAIVIATHTK